MSKKKVLLRGVFINRDTNGEGVLKVGTTLIRVSTVMGILYISSMKLTWYMKRTVFITYVKRGGDCKGSSRKRWIVKKNKLLME